MGKFIIEIRDDIGDYEGLEAVLSVVNSGRISNGDTQYCYHTEFYNGVHVSAMPKRKGSETDKFIVHLNMPKPNNR